MWNGIRRGNELLRSNPIAEWVWLGGFVAGVSPGGAIGFFVALWVFGYLG